MKTVRELLAAMGLAFSVGMVTVFYARMPATIATHFNAAGVADGSGGRAMLWVLVGTAVFLYAVMTAVTFLPLSVNLPWRMTPEQENAARVDAFALVGWVKVEMVWMIGYICLMMVRSGLGFQAELGRAYLPVVLAVVVATLGFYLVRMFRATRAAR